MPTTNKIASFIFAIMRKPVLTIAVNYRQSHTLIPRRFSVNFCGVSGKTPIAEDCNRRPAEVIRSWNELFSGYRKKAEEALITQFRANTDEMALLRDVEFYFTSKRQEGFGPLIQCALTDVPITSVSNDSASRHASG
jgi:GTP cyclohydrolase I